MVINSPSQNVLQSYLYVSGLQQDWLGTAGLPGGHPLQGQAALLLKPVGSLATAPYGSWTMG